MMKKYHLLLLTITLSMLSAASIAMQTFGPTKPGDSLWGIAEQHEIKGVTPTDMMSAIHIQNPTAFLRPSSDALKLGVKLQIPTTVAEVQQILSGTAPQPKVQAGSATVTPVQPVKQDELKALSDKLKITELSLQRAQAQNKSLQTQVAALTQKAEGHNVWTWLWFILWVFTLLLLIMRIRRQKRPDLGPMITDSAIADRPDLTSFSTEDQPQPTEMQQGELDMGAAASASDDIAETVADEPSEASDQLQRAQAEKKLVDAIAQDPSNIQKHTALLNFYVQHNQQVEFDGHLKQMVTDQVVKEGDVQWNRLRTMYLNQWVYDK